MKLKNFPHGNSTQQILDSSSISISIPFHFHFQILIQLLDSIPFPFRFHSISLPFCIDLFCSKISIPFPFNFRSISIPLSTSFVVKIHSISISFSVTIPLRFHSILKPLFFTDIFRSISVPLCTTGTQINFPYYSTGWGKKLFELKFSILNQKFKMT